MYSELEQKMEEEIAEFLEHNSFIYEDLASNNPQKAFHSKFIIHLLATTYFPNIKCHVHVEGLATHALVFCGIKGVLGLCGAAVFFFLPNLLFLNAHHISNRSNMVYSSSIPSD